MTARLGHRNPRLSLLHSGGAALESSLHCCDHRRRHVLIEDGIIDIVSRRYGYWALSLLRVVPGLFSMLVHALRVGLSIIPGSG